MNFRIFSVTPVPFLLCFLAGCTAVEPVKNEPDPRLDQMLAAVNQCVANQRLTTDQLANQAQQLELQRQQMQALGEQLEEVRKEGAPAAAAPALVDCPKPPKTSTMQVVGYIEQVWIPDLQGTLPTLIDTTVTTSALDVQHLEEFERDGKRWVKFTVLDSSGQPVWLEQRIKRTVSATSGDNATERRPVIRMGMTIGRINQTVDVVLYKRQHKTYQLKLGRDVLQDVIIVDVSKKNIAPYVPPEKPAAKDAKDAIKGNAQ